MQYTFCVAFSFITIYTEINKKKYMSNNELDMINGCSLFSNVGIDEYYFKDYGVEIKVANELLEKRAKFYTHVYPDVNMICGDITNNDIFNKIVEEYKKNKCEFLIATPPCQGMSLAGKQDKNDPRNFLITYVVKFISKTQPKNIMIENVPQILTTSIVDNNERILILDYLKKELPNYIINYKVCDACNYNTPQHRKRAIFLISKIKKWEFPEENKQWITTRDVIGNLPSLESGEKSNIKYHISKIHNDREILWLRHTPTGKTAFKNKFPYYPRSEKTIKNNGKERISCWDACYSRLKWDEPVATITMCNGSLGSQSNGHPGRFIGKEEDGTEIYSDARVLTVLELLRLTGLPDDYNIPEWAFYIDKKGKLCDNLVRQVIGECFPPKFASAMLTTMPK